MRKLITLVAGILLLGSNFANADEWTGKLVDTRCMAMNTMNSGQDHKAGAMVGCATACARMGIPVALLVGGKMFTIAAPAASFADYMAKDATISGQLTQDNIILPMKVIVDGKEVNVQGMM